MMIEVQNLSLFAQERAILSNINLIFSEGENIAIIGESGSGKSIFASAILGFLPEQITLRGTIKKNCKKIGAILQNPASCFDSIFSIESHFIETLKAHNLAKLPKEQWKLREVGLDSSVLEAYPFELSGGTLQRIMIALCLCIKPSFIIADEMTSDLDSSGTCEIVSLMKELQARQRFGMMFITHDLHLAAHMAQRVVVFHRGRVVEENSDILQNQKSDEARELFAQNRRLFDTPWGDFW